MARTPRKRDYTKIILFSISLLIIIIFIVIDMRLHIYAHSLPTKDTTNTTKYSAPDTTKENSIIIMAY